MRRIRIIGGCLAVLFAVSAVAAASASAALPELGRCDKVERVQEGKTKVWHGAYTNSGCTKTSPTKTGKYEWTAGPGEEAKFFGDVVEGGVVLETVGKAKVVCEVATVKGEYTGAKTEKLNTLVLAGCVSAGKPCQTTPATEGQIESLASLEGELGYISKAITKPSVGWDLKSASILFTYECGAPPEVGSVHTVEGSVIGVVAGGDSSDYDRMSLESIIKYKEGKGKQLPEAFEGGANDTLTTTSLSGLEKKTEQTGLTAVDETISGLGESVESEANQEPLEIKAEGEPEPPA